MVPWAGEFAGKYLTHSVQTYRLTRDPKLRDHLQWFVDELVTLQAEDGYLGPWPKEARLQGRAPNCGRETWDAWGHYHVMLGLLLWHDVTGSEDALDCCRRIGDLFCRRFLDGEESLHDSGCHEMNQAPAHSLVLLYARTGEQRYLDMAIKIKDEFAIPPAGDYLRQPLEGKPFWETPKPRWESLHPIMGLVELFYATGDTDYRQAFEHLWWSMLEGDRHNNGGFTSGEKATGNPYDEGAIETCCTVAWMAMSVEMLRLTGNPVVADELELSMLNSGLGLMSPSGRWVTYDTPMGGRREASAHTIVFQARAGQPELNCCSVNGPRALAMLCEWAVMRRNDGLALNYYGPGTIVAPLASGNEVRLTQDTDYPRTDTIRLMVSPQRTERWVLAVRVPVWSAATQVKLNGEAVAAAAGTYLELDREWHEGDTIEIRLDFAPRAWVWKERIPVQDWETEWALFGPVPTSAHVTECPDADVRPPLAGVGPVTPSIEYGGSTYASTTAKSKDGVIDARRLFPDVGGEPLLFGATELESWDDDEILLVYSADWRIRWFVNGIEEADTFRSGGNMRMDDSRIHHTWLPLRQGLNVVAFCNSGGSQRGCWVSVGLGPRRSELSALPPAQRVAMVSLYRGPVLLAYDPRLDAVGGDDVPALDLSSPELQPVEHDTWLKPWMLFEAPTVSGRSVRLCDFASAGAAGNPYWSWLPARGGPAAAKPFSRMDPSRAERCRRGKLD